MHTFCREVGQITGGRKSALAAEGVLHASHLPPKKTHTKCTWITLATCETHEVAAVNWTACMDLRDGGF